MTETEKYHTPHRQDAARAASRPRFRKSLCAALLRLAPCLLFALALAQAPAAFAQQKFSKTYRTPRRNIRIQLKNRSGTIEIVGWDRSEIRVSADMESPAAKFTPVVDDEGLVIDVKGDTHGREGLGDVNFRVQVPEDASVDLETLVGNITVRNIHGSMVRAVVTTSGDIDLTGVRVFKVMASNITGNILFDAELLSGGLYDLKSTQGNINVRLSGASGFTLTATAPRTRNIDLGNLATRGNFSFERDSRRVVGRVGDGSATLTTTNLRGSIGFFTY